MLRQPAFTPPRELTCSSMRRLMLLLLALDGCRPRAQAATPTTDASVPVVAKPDAAPPEEPVRVVPVDPDETPPVFVLRGAKGPRKMVFLHGLCGHGQGYVQAFQYAAARHGVVVAPQGDVLCEGPYRTWSGDVVKIDARITRAFGALGMDEPRDVAVMGYSLGATLAIRLARKWPERYTRLILIASPAELKTTGLGAVRSAVMMAGELDRKDLMRAGAKTFSSAGIASTFMELPGARHGEMGTQAERVMGEALKWPFDH